MSFADHGVPLLAVALLWFGSTGLVLWLDSRAPATFARSLVWGGVAAAAAALLLAWTIDDPGAPAAYLAFFAALTIWGWHELSFLTGVVTGPNRSPCPPALSGWQRFRAAAATLIHHEVALAVTALLLAGLAWGHANPVGAATFALLFVLRLSTKLNLFLGVPAFAAELLPPHLRYLETYISRAAANPLLPLSLAATVAGTIWLAQAALGSVGGTAVGLSLLTGLAALGLVEHLFLMIKFREASLWRWARAHAK